MADLGKTRIRRSDGLMLDERIVRTGPDTTHLSSSEKNTPTSPTGGINKDSDVIYSFPAVPGLKSKTLTFSYRLHPFKQDHAAVSYQYIDSTFTQRYTNHHGRPQERSVSTACSSLSLSLSLLCFIRRLHSLREEGIGLLILPRKTTTPCFLVC